MCTISKSFALRKGALSVPFLFRKQVYDISFRCYNKCCLNLSRLPFCGYYARGWWVILSLLIQLAKKLALWPEATGFSAKLRTTLVLSIPVFIFCALFSLTRWAVVWDGEVVAVAGERRMAETAVQEYINKLEETAGIPVNIPEDTIKYHPIWRMTAVKDKQELQRCLADELDLQYEACGIFIDGKRMLVVKDKSVGSEVLDEVLSAYRQDDNWQAHFKQKIAMQTVLVDMDELMEVDRAVEYMQCGGTDVQKYQVQAGDTLWDVAASAGISVEQLIETNPGLSTATLSIGREIKISRHTPLVDVLSTYENIEQEEILVPVQEKIDQELYWGEQKIVQEGSSGQREVVYQVTLENGQETGRKVVRQKTIKEPEPQIIVKGNKKLLASRGGSSRLAYPTSGAIVSPFGTRWGRDHQGVDIAASSGTPVVASEDGTIEWVGNQGGYGICVDISHGSGVVTRYAHLSSTSVQSGQRVARGQCIGRVGSTGNSTGPHLHFEVIINGVHKDPTMFI